MGREATNGNDETDNDNNNNNNSNNSNNNNSSGINIFNLITCHLYIFSFQNFEWTLKNDCSSRSSVFFAQVFPAKNTSVLQ